MNDNTYEERVTITRYEPTRNPYSASYQPALWETHQCNNIRALFELPIDFQFMIGDYDIMDNGWLAAYFGMPSQAWALRMCMKGMSLDAYEALHGSLPNNMEINKTVKSAALWTLTVQLELSQTVMAELDALAIEHGRLNAEYRAALSLPIGEGYDHNLTKMLYDQRADVWKQASDLFKANLGQRNKALVSTEDN